jgi:hypothetical protein
MFFASGLFHKSFSPGPLLVYNIRAISIFFENSRISRCTNSINDTCGKWKKIFNQKVFKYSVYTLLGSSFHI